MKLANTISIILKTVSRESEVHRPNTDWSTKGNLKIRPEK